MVKLASTPTATTGTATVGGGRLAKDVTEPKSPTTTTTTVDGKSVPVFRRFSRSNSLTGTLPGQLPRFYYPNGRPYSSHEVESQIKKIIAIFERFPSRTVSRKEFGGVLKLVGIPVYWKGPLFQVVLAHQAKANSRRNSQVLSRSNSIDASHNNNNGTLLNGNGKKEYISCEHFADYWKKYVTSFLMCVPQGRL